MMLLRLCVHLSLSTPLFHVSFISRLAFPHGGYITPGKTRHTSYQLGTSLPIIPAKPQVGSDWDSSRHLPISNPVLSPARPGIQDPIQKAEGGVSPTQAMWLKVEKQSFPKGSQDTAPTSRKNSCWVGNECQYNWCGWGIAQRVGRQEWWADGREKSKQNKNHIMDPFLDMQRNVDFILQATGSQLFSPTT